MLDPNFTGNTIENPYQLVNFFDVNITSNEIIIIKKYYYKYPLQKNKYLIKTPCKEELLLLNNLLRQEYISKLKKNAKLNRKYNIKFQPVYFYHFHLIKIMKIFFFHKTSTNTSSIQ